MSVPWVVWIDLFIYSFSAKRDQKERSILEYVR